MEEFLDKLINESSYSTFERSLETMGRENYIKDEYFKDRIVLVGSLRNKEHLEVNLKGKGMKVFVEDEGIRVENNGEDN